MIITVCLVLALAGWAVYAVGTMPLADPPQRGIRAAAVAAWASAASWVAAVGYGVYAVL